MLKIFTEGNDKYFLENYIESQLSKKVDIDFDVTPTGGWTKLKAARNKIEEDRDAGHRVCIIYDADFPTEGGVSKRLSEIKAIILGIEQKSPSLPSIEIFLFPNNSDNGDFETLLELIANEDRNGIFECFSQYEECIKIKLNAKSKEFNLPIRKSRIFAYAETFPEKKKKKENFKNFDFLFKNEDYWDLKSTHLNPLKNFLSSLF